MLKILIIFLLYQTFALIVSIDHKIYAQAPIKTQWFKEIKKNQYEVDRATFNTHLSNIDQFSHQVAIVPHFKEGKPIGFKVIKIEDQSFLLALGFKSGDIVKSINCVKLGSIAQSSCIQNAINSSIKQV